jgi:hypothetical protein
MTNHNNEKTIKLLKETLEWYADEDNYNLTQFGTGLCNLDLDRGSKAKMVLEEINKNKKSSPDLTF